MTQPRSVALVTGASSGIGAAVARRFGRAGMHVVGVGRDRSALVLLCDEIRAVGGDADWIECDLTDTIALESLVPRITAQIGDVDVLVNCAGVSHARSILASADDVRQVIAVNFEAPAALMRAVTPGMRARRRGAIVNIGSIAGEFGVAGTYSASKSALKALTGSARRELRGSGIGITLIEPLHVDTRMRGERRRHALHPDRVADAVHAAVRTPRRRVVLPRYATILTIVEPLVPFLVDVSRASRRSGT